MAWYRPGSRTPAVGEVETGLAALNRLDRHLFGGFVANCYTVPAARPLQDLPRSGPAAVGLGAAALAWGALGGLLALPGMWFYTLGRGALESAGGWAMNVAILFECVSGVRIYQATKEGQRWRSARGMDPWARADGTIRRPTPGWFFWPAAVVFSVLAALGLGAGVLLDLYGSTSAPDLGPGLGWVILLSLTAAPLGGLAIARSIRPRAARSARRAAPPMPPALPPAGWFPDPQLPGRLRYWDGGRWTEHVHS